MRFITLFISSVLIRGSTPDRCVTSLHVLIVVGRSYALPLLMFRSYALPRLMFRSVCVSSLHVSIGRMCFLSLCFDRKSYARFFRNRCRVGNPCFLTWKCAKKESEDLLVACCCFVYTICLWYIFYTKGKL
jgi:hypothetical protein